MNDARNDIIDIQADQDNRETALANFIRDNVWPGISTGKREVLDSLINNYGKAQYGRGYQAGAQDAWRGYGGTC